MLAHGFLGCFGSILEWHLKFSKQYVKSLKALCDSGVFELALLISQKHSQQTNANDSVQYHSI